MTKPIHLLSEARKKDIAEFGFNLDDTAPAVERGGDAIELDRDFIDLETLEFSRDFAQH